jgi:hypothetical protein
LILIPAGVVIEIAGETTRQERNFGEKAKAAGAKAGASIKAAFSLVRKKIKKTGKPSGAFGIPEYDDTAKKQEQPSAETFEERPSEHGNRRRPIHPDPGPTQSVLEGKELHADLSSAPKSRLGNIELECYTCENLINCEIRSSPAKSKEKQLCPKAGAKN